MKRVASRGAGDPMTAKSLLRRSAAKIVPAVVMAGMVSSAVATPAFAKDRSATKFAKVVEPNSYPEMERAYDGMFANRPAVQRVRVPGSFFISRPRDANLPGFLMDKRIEIDIRSSVPRLTDLQTLLDMQGVSLAIDRRSLSGLKDADPTVGSFTAASRYQAIANSANGNQNAGLGGNSGFGNGGIGGIGGIGGGVGGGLGGFGGLSGGVGSSNTPAVTITGSAGGGGGGSGQDGQSGLSGGLTGGQASGRADKAAEYGAIQGSGFQGSGEGGAAGAETDKGPAFYDRVLPFRYFKGTVGELVQRLENSGDLAVWYDHGLVLGEVRRYSVAIMQNIDISQSVVNELIRLGARDVVGSIGAGQVFYSAGPRINAELIEPYLRRISTNLSEVTLQVALVTVSMTKNAERGFDWSAFNLQLGNGTGSVNDTQPQSGNGVLNSSSFNAVFGVGLANPVSIAGAIRFLSRMGDTSVTQNVELRTLSGAPVVLRSGENIPYIQNVGSNVVGGLGGAGITGSTQTASLATGLTLNVDPRYDADTGIVTMDVGVKLVDLVEFVQLSAGNQVGTLSQPRTREQGLNSILRVPAGQTSIVGGIRRDLTSETKTAPFGLWGIGSRNRQREIFWVFTIVRPVVTVFETSDVPSVPRSILDTTTTVNPRAPQWGRGPSELRAVPGGVEPVRQYDPATGSQPYTPANRLPAGVVIAQPPAPRNLVVVSPGSPPEVVPAPAVPANTVTRIPVKPSVTLQVQGNAVTTEGAPVSLPLAPAPGTDPVIDVVPTTVAPPVTATGSQQAPARSFLRPMTSAEIKRGN